ncbi:MAG TPA: hypothetical protein VF450_02860 [Noviherbaspirillum sp.]
MRAIKKALVAVIIIFVGAIAVTLMATRSSNAPATAPVQKTAKELHNEGVQAAIYGCETVTRRASKLAVGEIVDEYELTGKTKPGHYRVGFDYRAQGTGLLMVANCEYMDAGNGNVALVSQISQLK